MVLILRSRVLIDWFSFLDPGFSLVSSHSEIQGSHWLVLILRSRVGLVSDPERFLLTETVFNRRYKKSGVVALG